MKIKKNPVILLETFIGLSSLFY